MAPKVTVLSTLFNKGPYVEEAIESVLAQTFTDFELLVVDDASTDDGPERVRRYTDPRIRIIANPTNLGRAGAANRGWSAAQGTYVAVLDADDMMMPDRLSEQVAYLDAHPEVGALGTYVRYFGATEGVGPWPLTDRECRGRMLIGDPILYGTAMFRKAHLDAHGVRYPEDWRRPGMDYLFLLEAARATRFAGLPNDLTAYRIGEQNMRHGRDQLKDRAATYRAAFDKLGVNATDQEIDLQLMLHDLHTEPLSARRVRQLHAWLVDLQERAERSGLFDPEVFRHEWHRRWDRLYFKLADQNTAAALAHLRVSRDFRIARWRYLLATAWRVRR